MVEVDVAAVLQVIIFEMQLNVRFREKTIMNNKL